MVKNELIAWRNLAPAIIRQRLVIEGTTKLIIGPEKIKLYLTELAKVTGMEVVSGPFTSSAHGLGFCGWIHWKTSGCHVYSYSTSPPLFTVDTYTCKPFCIEEAVKFTKEFFSMTDIVYQEVKV